MNLRQSVPFAVYTGIGMCISVLARNIYRFKSKRRFCHQIIQVSNAYIADLLWVLESPSLIKRNSQLFDDVFPVSHFQEICKDRYIVPKLIDFIEKQMKQRGRLYAVGYYFESMFAFLCDQSPDFDILMSNMQIIDGKRTCGEIDFVLINHHHRKLIHIETACKFYLLKDNAIDTTDLTQYIGTQTSDIFNIKFHKIVQRQLMLSNGHIFKDILQHMNVSSYTLHREVFFKGILFFHMPSLLTEWEIFQKNVIEHIQLPPEVFSGCIKGFWCRLSDIRNVFSHNFYYSILQKPKWLTNKHAPILSCNDFLLHVAKISADWIAGKNNRIYISVTSIGSYKKEICRAFIVDNTWPNSRTKSK